MALRGHVFDKQLFSSDCYALVTDTFLGKQSGIIRGCDMTHTTSLIHINEGYFVVKGRPIQEEGGSNIKVEPGNIDGSYCKLVCELDMSKNNTTTELNQVSYKIVEDVTNYPVLTQEDITDSGTIYQFELAKFRRTLNGIEDFVDTRSFLNFDSIYEEVRNEIKKIEDGSIFVTEEEMREVGVAVSPTEPTTNEKVWLQKGKNLLDLSKCDFANCILNDDGTITSQINDFYYCSVFTTSLNNFLLDNKGKTITLSTGTPLNNKITSIIINGIRTNGENYQEAGEDSTGNASIIIAEDFTSITSLEVRFNRQYEQITDYTTKINYLQLELGEATEYEEYKEKKIYCKNDNGIFEEFINVSETENRIISFDINLANGETFTNDNLKNAKIVIVNWKNSSGWSLQTIHTVDGYSLNTYNELSCGSMYNAINGTLKYQYSSDTSVMTINKITVIK